MEMADGMGKVAALLVATDLESGASVPLPANSNNPGGDMGSLALDVYRTPRGYDGLKNIGLGYQSGYNSMAKRLRIATISYVDIKNGIGAVLPQGATAAERIAIPAAM